MKFLGLWSARQLEIFFEKFVKPPGPPPTYLAYAALLKTFFD